MARNSSRRFSYWRVEKRNPLLFVDYCETGTRKVSLIGLLSVIKRFIWASRINAPSHWRIRCIVCITYTELPQIPQTFTTFPFSLIFSRQNISRFSLLSIILKFVFIFSSWFGDRRIFCWESNSKQCKLLLMLLTLLAFKEPTKILIFHKILQNSLTFP